MSNRYTLHLQNTVLAAEPASGRSGTQLPDFGDIYTSYAQRSNLQDGTATTPQNGSQDLLDSNLNQVGDNSPPVRKSSQRMNPTRAQAVFQAMNERSGNALPHTPQRNDSPGLSDSFDFTQPIGQTGLHSSSLNVLLDTPSSESQYRQLVLTPPVIETNYRHHGRHVESQENLDEDTSNVDVLLRSESVDNWAEKGGAERTISSSSSGYDYKVIRRTVKDFEFGKDIGEGSYSTVVLATDKLTSKKYAVKILDKRHIIKEKKVKYVNIEKHALNRLSGCPGVISLFFTFQDKHSLYFVLDFAANGELLGLIKQYGTLNEECTRYFGAQMLDAIKFMHDNGVIHRDIKPENVLLDENYRIQITDFGTAKLLERKKNGDTGEEEDYPVDVRAKSFVGTAEYVSPELLESKYCGKPGDIWALGCILYQLIAGKPPFKATNEYLTFQKITKLQYAFSAGFPLVLRDLIKQVLVLQPSRRATINQIQKHHFFHEIDFEDTDAIWNSPVPELGPYKMTAKSMMKMPPAPKAAAKKIIRKPGKKKAVSQTNSPQQPEKPGQKRVTSDGNSKNYSAASVAAYVFHKQDEDEAPQNRSNPSASATARKPSAPEYIPGTNILRPVINSRANFSRSSVSQNSSSFSTASTPTERRDSKPAEIPPISSVELAWKDYLTDPDERVLHVGQAIVCKQPTDYFDKKHKGLIHNAPLKYVSQLQAAAKVGGNDSMLTRVAQGNKGGLRSAPDAANYVANEKDAIVDFSPEEEPDPKITSIPEDEDLPSSPVDGKEKEDHSNGSGKSASKFGKKFLKKFLNHSEKNEDGNSDAASTKSGGSGGNGRSRSSSFSLERARNCTLVATTHGRFLIFIKEGNAEPKLINEIFLNFPFIQIKEVVTNHTAKFGKIIPVTGIFAVQAIESTFVFEVDKYEVDIWTVALARSKLGQFDRERERNRSASTVSQSPKLLDAPSIKSTPPVPKEQKVDPAPAPPSSAAPPVPHPISTRKVSNETGPELPKSQQNHSKEPGLPKQTLDPRGHLMFRSRAKQSKSMKRKPPPPLPKGNVGHTGLARDPASPDHDTLHAALLAVNNNPVAKHEERRSSFSKANPTSPTQNITYRYQSPSNGKGRITAMNSKLLNRTRDKQ
ncbi:hypothetical protein C7M61_003373 [Candidozyma pseudohaemuli]|uniref:non-specific serine/threonine protein kinase n=1 Tax=Candidozyma pseudohaemuli TaxID=418784 RepID=A0A2P7YNW9_9ASCO|nr:hypothetical protein C7M61_003373 [[Candida] pseudohaemulonii]PSK37666.1 hypothetical protein C7M61_003373 [[Candida] pseudohaemulonii]